MEEGQARSDCRIVWVEGMVIIYILAAIGAYVVVRKVYDIWEEIHYGRTRREQSKRWDEDDD